MTLPSLENIASSLTILFALSGALLAAFWLSLVIWAFRDMRLRSRDIFAQIMAAVLVAVIPFFGILIYLILRPPETLAEKYERALEEEALLQEIETRPSCHSCSRTVDPRWMLCAHCEAQVKKRCVSCSELMNLNWERCPFCATEQKMVANSTPVSYEIRQATDTEQTVTQVRRMRRAERSAPYADMLDDRPTPVATVRMKPVSGEDAELVDMDG